MSRLLPKCNIARAHPRRRFLQAAALLTASIFTGCKSSSPSKKDTWRIQDLVVNPERRNVLLAVRFNGFGSPEANTLFYSDDRGRSFTPLFAADKVEVNNADPRTVYAFSRGRIYRSTNWGKTFRERGEIGANFLGSMFSDRFNPNKLYLGHHNVGTWGVYISEDGGKTSKFIPFGSSIGVSPELKKYATDRILWDINQDPQNPSSLFVTGEQGSHSSYPKGKDGEWILHHDPLYTLRSQDGGLTWESCSSGLDWHSTQVVPYINSNGKTVWISIEEGPQMREFDEKTNQWVKKGPPAFQYKIDPDNQKTHFMIHADGHSLLMSNDAGATWQTIIRDESARFTGITPDGISGKLYLVDWNTRIKALTYK
jgi:photosystem II stability/assembly factor-like uncharacterized protein